MRITGEQAQELGRAAAARVLGHLEGERLIPRFIDSYVMGFDRPQLKSPADQFRQRSSQLGWEALLLLSRLVLERCSARFFRFQLGPLRVPDAVARREFSASFWSALAAGLPREGGATADLSRQAEGYRDPHQRLALFSSRIAPLLDPQPQMKDKAEHAGRKFFQALEQVAGQVAARLFPTS